MLACCIAAAGIVAGSAALAAEPPFKRARFTLAAEKQPLAEVLRAFAASQDWTVVISDEIQGTISARFSLPPREFWSTVTGSYNLGWYYDGSLMHVGPATDQRTEMIAMSRADYRRWFDALTRLSLVDSHAAPRYDATAGVAVLAGHPRFVEVARSLWSEIENGSAGADGLAVRVFALTSAMAADQSTSMGGQQIKVEGIASVIRRVMLPDGGGSDVSAVSGAQGSVISGGAQRQSPLRSTAPGAPSGEGDRQSLSGAPVPGPQPSVAASVGTQRRAGRANAARVEADGATNSIIVRDRPERLPEYQQLIEQLDRPRLLVEIEARMVEVEQDELSDLGIDLSVNGRRGSVETSNGVGAAGSSTAPQIVATLVDGAANRLLARVRALEGRGKAKIVTTPRLLTLDRTEASLESTETAFVRVAGNQDANLFSVQAGSALRIVPSVLGEASQRRIRLLLNIEDGRLSDVQVDNVPVVQRHRVFSQSEVAEGMSLLVGGLSDVREESSAQGVPGLSRVPILGALFGRKASSRSSRERLYLITPKVVPTMPPGSPPGPPPTTSVPPVDHP